jgi:hypothetical protein
LSERLEAETAASSQSDTSAETARVHELEAEVLRLRDALIGLDAEAGQLRGERDLYAAEVQGSREAVIALQAVLSSRSWRTSRKLLAPVDRVRRFLGR